MLPYWDLLEERIYWSGEEQPQMEGALVISFFIRNWFCSAIFSYYREALKWNSHD